MRPYRPDDRDGVAHVCLLTARAGGDATGVYSDDSLMPDVYALPYVDRAPEFAWVVVTGSPERVVGYVIGVPDTAEFIDWWGSEYLPVFDARHPEAAPPTEANPAYSEASLIADGRNPERMRIPELADYPAHLHIDLLPEAQRRGLGRRLVDTLRAALAEAGVSALHLGYAAENENAGAFYARLGFHPLPSSTETAPRVGIATA
ncbi:GNAT family N-acetyltransferase [Agromyces sp. MMS17-SY077]|uniref:GNAT family N-acetyltransferase n=1 Tax=Agromyces seonyuensis TaxID=2662446 RepID=A0A6I4P0C6_9MICO|nr:GNAT family N-acetyltransferase [Agromyces seonyuensis]